MRRRVSAAFVAAIIAGVLRASAPCALEIEQVEPRTSPGPGSVGTLALTLEDTLRRARERAPAVLAARAAVEEARGRLIGASVLLRDDLEVDALVGTRSGVAGHSKEREFGIMQRFETGGRRGARRQGAEAGVVRASAAADDVVRRAQRAAGEAFLRALHAEERRRLAADAEEIAVETLEMVEKRLAAGEVAVLDVNLARLALGRARSDVAEAEAGRAAALGDLRAVLGLDPALPVTVRGALGSARGYAGEVPAHDEPALLTRAAERPDLKALDAELRAAEADLRLGKALIGPEIGVGARYEREEADDVWMGGVTFSLPVFDHGQGVRAEAGARAGRLRLELDAARRVVAAEVHAAFETWRRREAAATILDKEALPAASDNESLGRRSYEAGQIGLVEFLLVRRATLETRGVHLDRLLEAALASLDLELKAGVIP